MLHIWSSFDSRINESHINKGEFIIIYDQVVNTVEMRAIKWNRTGVFERTLLFIEYNTLHVIGLVVV